MTDATEVIGALADPTRRAIFEMIAKGPRSVAELSRSLPVSQSAVSQHLKVLRGAQLVSFQRVATRNLYRVDPIGLARIRRYLDDMWSEALTSFSEELNGNGKGGDS